MRTSTLPEAHKCGMLCALGHSLSEDYYVDIVASFILNEKAYKQEAPYFNSAKFLRIMLLCFNIWERWEIIRNK